MEFTLESLLSVSPSHHYALDLHVPMVSAQYGATASASQPAFSFTNNNLNAITTQHHTFIDSKTTDEQFLFDLDLSEFDFFGTDLALDIDVDLFATEMAVKDISETDIDLGDLATEQLDELLLFGLGSFSTSEADFAAGDSQIDASNSYEVSLQSAPSSVKRKRESFDASDETLTGDSSNDGIDSSAKSKRSRRSPGEGKEKKQSNKEAAIRYRHKKTREKETLFHERDSFESENRELKKKIDDVQTEINFVKNILVEMLLKKNILSNLEFKL